jgi:tetratricopeptide (TPR) repeat protein
MLRMLVPGLKKQSAATCSLTIACMIAQAPAFALTPEQIFAKDSPSIVVIVAYGADGQPLDLGSGVVIAQDQVVTNCHVVKNGTTLRVKQDKVAYPATLHFADFDRDLCQLTVPKLTAPAIAIGDANSLQTGESVVAIGAPEGLELTISSGLISSLRDFGDGSKLIQTSASISPGSSGGGLFDDQGRLIGITFAQYKEGQNLNFALPVNWISRLSHYPATQTRSATTSSVNWIISAIKMEDKQDWGALNDLARKWTQSKPDSYFAWYALGESFQNLLQYRNAEKAYIQSLHLNPNNGVTWYSLGTTCGEAKQYQDAVIALSQAVKFDSSSEAKWRDLGNAYAGWEHYGEAIAAYHHALAIDASQAATWYFLGKSYFESKQYELAADSFRHVLKFDPNDANALDYLGNAYGQLARYADAASVFRTEVRIAPTAQAWFNLGQAYALQGDHSGVADVYEHLQTLNPKMAGEFFDKWVTH